MVSSAAKPLALCFSGADVLDALSICPDCRPVALTPDARAALVAKDCELLTSSISFTDCDHARVVVWMRQVERAARRAAADFPLVPAVSDTVVDRLVRLAAITGQVWHTVFRGPLAKGPWLVGGQGRWQLYTPEQRDNALIALIDQVSPQEEDARAGDRGPMMPRLFAWLRDRVAVLAGWRRGWIVSPRPKLTFDLDRFLYERERPVRVLMPTIARGNAEYMRLANSLLLILWRLPQVLTLGIVKDRSRASLRREIQAIVERVAVSAVKPVAASRIHELTHIADAIDHHVGDACRLMRNLQPKLLVSYQSSSVIARITVEAAARARIKRLMFNYNSHTTPHGAIANSANERHYRLKVVNTLSDIFACWSPAAAALTGKLLGDRSSSIMPVLSVRSTRTSPASSERPRVLHAGSFMGWPQCLPWIIETSDEYCDSILALDRAMAALPDTELVVRAKKKSECAPEHLAQLLAARPGLSITDTSTPFRIAMQQADLLVSFMSTTIEEALILRRPVLLWGPVRRYRHLPARTTLPVGDDRAAVYVVQDESTLGPMIAAILQAHRGRPLTDSEVAPFVWPAGVPDVENLASAIAAGDPSRPWHTEAIATQVEYSAG